MATRKEPGKERLARVAATRVVGVLMMLTAAVEASVYDCASLSDLEAFLTDGTFLSSEATRVNYTGATATLAAGFQLATGSGTSATTIDVTDANTTLAIQGPFATTSVGPFIKKGAGALTFKPTNADAETAIRLGSGGGSENGSLVWDATTGNGTASTYALNVAGGDLILDGAYKFITGNVKSGLTYTGEAPPRLIIRNGAKLTSESTTVIAGGNSLTAEGCQNASIIVDGEGSEYYLKGGYLWLSWYFGRGGTRGKPVLTAQNGAKIYGSSVFVAGRSESDVTINALSGGSIAYNMSSSARRYPFVSNDLRTGEWWNSGSSFTTTFNIDGTNSAFRSLFGVYGNGVTVNASDGGLLKYNHVGLPWATNAEPGAVSGVFDEKRPRKAKYNFNGGGMGCYDVGSAEWMTLTPFWKVGPKGALFDVCANADAALDGTAALTDGAGTIVKTGTGTLSLRPQAADVKVLEGSVHFAVPDRGSKQQTTGTVSVVNASDLHASGSMALGGMTVPASVPLHLRGRGFESVFRNWTYINDLDGSTHICQFTTYRPDGFISTGLPSYPDANTVGNAWYNEKVAVDRSFTLEYDVFIRSLNNNRNPIGFSAIWQNSDAGLAAHGGHGDMNSGGLGFGGAEFSANGKTYAGTASTLTENSFAVGFNVNSGSVAFGANAEMTDIQACSGWGQESLADIRNRPYRVVIRYDADAHVISMSMRGNKNGAADAPVWVKTHVVDLAETCGASTAWFGFGALHWNQAQGEVCFGNVHLTYDDDVPGRPTLLVGGKVSVAGHATWTTKLSPDADAAGFGFGALAFSDGATLDISTDPMVRGLYTAPGSPYLGFEEATGAGTLVKTGDAYLALSEWTTNTIRNVRLAAGGITLRKETLEPVRQRGRLASNWFTSKVDPTVGYHGGMRLGGSKADHYLATNYVKTTSYNDENINLRRRVRIDRPWRMTCKVEHRKPENNVSLGETFSFYVYNHSKGPEKVGNHHGGLWSDDYHYFGVGLASSRAVLMDNGLRGSLWDDRADDVRLRTRADTSTPSFSEVYAPSTLTITCDPANTNLTATVSRNGSTTTYSWENDRITPETFVGQKFAYPGFGCYQSGSRYLSEVYDFEFETLDPEDMWGEQDYLETLTVASDAAEVVADCSITNAQFTLAKTVTLEENSQLTLMTSRVPAKIAAVAVAGAGTVVVDGVTFKTASVSDTSVLRLVNGGQVEVDAGVLLKPQDIYVNGVKVSAGSYDASCGWIVGSGRVCVGHGMTIIFR